MHHYSYAGTSRGKTDPEEIHAVTVDGGACEIERCEDEEEHFVLMWSGNEYSKDHTWIMADTDYTVSLDDAL
jgi:hypothetical protein